MGRLLWIAVLLSACGEPILRNAPTPDPGAVAGVAAAAAAAATLASPQGAAKRQEQKDKRDPDNRGVVVKETVPAAAFDRLDQPPSAASDAGTDAPPSAQPASQPAARPSGSPAPGSATKSPGSKPAKPVLFPVPHTSEPGSPAPEPRR